MQKLRPRNVPLDTGHPQRSSRGCAISQGSSDGPGHPSRSDASSSPHIHRESRSSNQSHRPLGTQHNLAASLSEVEHCVIPNDYTIRHNSKVFQIVREDIRPRMRRAAVRLESRRNGEIAVRFEDRYVRIAECQPALKSVAAPAARKSLKPAASPPRKSK